MQDFVTYAGAEVGDELAPYFRGSAGEHCLGKVDISLLRSEIRVAGKLFDGVGFYPTNENTRELIQNVNAFQSVASPNVSVNNAGVESAIREQTDVMRGIQYVIDVREVYDRLQGHNREREFVGDVAFRTD